MLFNKKKIIEFLGGYVLITVTLKIVDPENDLTILRSFFGAMYIYLAWAIFVSMLASWIENNNERR